MAGDNMKCSCGKPSFVQIVWDENKAPCYDCYIKLVKKHNKFKIKDVYKKLFKEK